MKGSPLVQRQQASPNHEARLNAEKPSYIVLHYTGMTSGTAAVNWLCDVASKVSSHYLVDSDGAIVQMVDEDRRAWHAGVSAWQGRTDLNSASIGIEIQNLGHAGGLPAFPKVQMQQVALLCLDIMRRHDMPTSHVLAHSDIAPGRKIDPGEAFDWRWLAAQGIGNMIAATTNKQVVSIETAQQLLGDLGYGLDKTGVMDPRTRHVVEAFQRRYRPTRVDGEVDAETSTLLQQLLAINPA